MRKQLLTDIAKLSPHCQTSAIEAFHSLILQFAPKNVVFTYKGMLCRYGNLLSGHKISNLVIGKILKSYRSRVMIFVCISDCS